MELQSADRTDWLVETKLRPPSLRQDVIARPRLIGALRAALTEHRLTLIAAPAGYGKTTLIADACRADPPLQAVWLALDEGDNDPAAFLTLLIEALRHVHAGCGSSARALLIGLANPAAEARKVIGALINDLMALSGPVVIIFDDLHAIGEAAIFVAIDYLIERLPTHIHLAATTRYDPPLALPRLRARGEMAEFRNDVDCSATIIERALACPSTPPVRVQLLLERARVFVVQRQTLRGLADLQQALRIVQEMPDPDVLAACISHLYPIFAAAPGGIDTIERICGDASARFAGEISPVRAAVEGQRALIHLWRGRFDDCIVAADRAIAIAEQCGSANPLLHLWATGAPAICHTARDEHQAAQPYFNRILERSALIDSADGLGAVMAYVWGWACCLRKQHALARQTLQRADALGSQALPVLRTLHILLRGLIEMGEGQTAAAEVSLREAVALEQTTPAALLFGSAKLLLARLYLATRRPRQALAELRPVLRHCAAQGTAGTILREGRAIVPLLRLAVERDTEAAYAATLLELLGQGQLFRAVPVPHTGETLSAREVELLHLLATGATNREIATRLIIGEPTVKTHLIHIFQKLDVRSRTEAASRARDLHII